MCGSKSNHLWCWAGTAFEIGSVDIDPSLEAFAMYLEATSFFLFGTGRCSPSFVGAPALGPK
jgi:hypothetical protein